jgi:hypothetical protein
MRRQLSVSFVIKSETSVAFAIVTLSIPNPASVAALNDDFGPEAGAHSGIDFDRDSVHVSRLYARLDCYQKNYQVAGWARPLG